MEAPTTSQALSVMVHHDLKRGGLCWIDILECWKVGRLYQPYSIDLRTDMAWRAPPTGALEPIRLYTDDPPPIWVFNLPAMRWRSRTG
jgi:hypothetical protein